jgi:hypothetical protein
MKPYVYKTGKKLATNPPFDTHDITNAIALFFINNSHFKYGPICRSIGLKRQPIADVIYRLNRKEEKPYKGRETLRPEYIEQLLPVIEKMGFTNVSRKVSIESIEGVVCGYFKVNSEEIKSESRKGDIPKARHICMKLTRDNTKLKDKDISAYFGNRDRTTAIYAYKNVGNMLETNKKYKAQYEEIKNILKNISK